MRVGVVLADSELVTSIRQYLDTYRDFPKYDLTQKDIRTVKYDKVGWIAARLCSKPFRKAKLNEETLKDIKNKVKISVEANKPIYLIILFGGYKHFWNPSYPEVDFAELFNLNFMCNYVEPILKMHAPGVTLDYESEDVIMWMDNYPDDALDAYANSFKALLAAMQKNFPGSFRINYVRAREQYDKEKLFSRINELAPKRREEWKTLSQEELDLKLHRSPNNIMWKGKEDWSSLGGEERKQKIFESKVINETFYDADFELRGDYLTGGNHIPLVLSWGLTYENTAKWLTLGSTYASSADFWTGRGILERRDGRFIPRVVSRKQYALIKDRLKTINVDYLPLRNFKSIEVYEDKISFDAVLATSS